MAAAPRSLLAFWSGGAVQDAAQTGVRSMLAPWAGGASVGLAPVTQIGVRSLLGFWMGGAAPGPDETGGSTTGGEILIHMRRRHRR